MDPHGVTSGSSGPTALPTATSSTTAARERMQRKVVTVLFADIVGSTALGESLDPEALRAFLGRCIEHVKAAAEGHGGRVGAPAGDGVMAFSWRTGSARGRRVARA